MQYHNMMRTQIPDDLISITGLISCPAPTQTNPKNHQIAANCPEALKADVAPGKDRDRQRYIASKTENKLGPQPGTKERTAVQHLYHQFSRQL